MATTIIVTPATPSSDPAGHYASLSDLVAVDGQTNLEVYSSVDGETPGTVNVERVQVALTFADSYIDAKIRRYASTGGFSVPVATSFDGFELLKFAAARYATAWLYNSRGGRDTPINPLTGQIDGGATKSAVWQGEAEQAIAQFIEAACNTLPPGTFQNVDIIQDTGAVGARPFLPGWW